MIFPEKEQLTNEGDVQIFAPPDVDFDSEPFDLGEPIGFDDNTFFPKGDGFLDDILNGQFEFPLDDEISFTYFNESSSGIGLAREEKVADIVGGTIARNPQSPKKDLKVSGGGTSIKIDVLGPNGEYIIVGGKGKGSNKKAVDDTGDQTARLKRIADANGVKAQAYFVDDISQAAIDIAKEKLGEENVFVFPEAQVD